MAAYRIPTNDMHTAVGAMLDEAKQKNADPFTFGKNISIHTPLVEAICKALSISAPKESDKLSDPRRKR